MKTIVVGGNISTKKESKIINEIAKELYNYTNNIVAVYNGRLPKTVSGYDLILWMPDIPNEEIKNYPIKDKGAVLICSKVMREDYTHFDSVSRIFKMHGNAVIEIYKDSDIFNFELRDALNNKWGIRKADIKTLTVKIMRFYEWSKKQVRKSLIQVPSENIFENLKAFLNINKQLSYKVIEQCGDRYFGNFSTRCTKLFPSSRTELGILVSKRNLDKRKIDLEDLVLCTDNFFYGNDKPSVDTPIQLELYKRFPDINYMIHGHAYVEGAEYTTEYYPCGDLREANETSGFIEEGIQAINLLNHGFLLVSKSIQEMYFLLNMCNFKHTWNS